MKISVESSRMVLKDHNYTGFLGGAVFFVIGLGLVYMALTGAAQQQNGWLLPVVGAVFAIVGAYLVVTTKIVMIVIDKGMGKASVSLQGLMKRDSREIPLDSIKALTLTKSVRTTHSSKGGSSTSYQYDLSFETDGGAVPFDFGSVSAGITDMIVSPDEKKRKEAQQVADFIGVQLRFVGPPSIGEAFTAIKEGIAEGMERTAKKSGEQ